MTKVNINQRRRSLVLSAMTTGLFLAIAGNIYPLAA